MSSFVSFHCVALALPVLVTAQLSGTVGPLTSRAAKAAVQVCNILNYCGEASATYDNGAAILAEWTACIDGGEGMNIPHLVHVSSADIEKSISQSEAMDLLPGLLWVVEMLSPSILRVLSTELGKSVPRWYIGIYSNQTWYSTDDGNMILVESTTDFECYSGNFQGAIQGYGYEFAECE